MEDSGFFGSSNSNRVESMVSLIFFQNKYAIDFSRHSNNCCVSKYYRFTLPELTLSPKAFKSETGLKPDVCRNIPQIERCTF
jgi:hypothetical protein